MFQRLSKTTLALAAVCSVGMAQADVLTFEDRPNAAAFFLADYQGFTFGTNNIATTAWFSTAEISTFYTPNSGSRYVSTDFQLYTGALWEATQAISSTTPFTFDGAWFSGGDQVRYELYSGNTLVFTSPDSPVLTAVNTWVPSGHTGLVTSVVIVGRQGFYAMDDFTFNTPIPEPTTFGMMGAGLLGVAALVRRRRVR
jgi:PEP-CTERM motif